MEIKIEMQKDDVIKNIDENLVSDYLHMGWNIVEKKSKELDEEDSKLSFRRNSRN